MDKISTLWQGASYQDNLLQSYRNFHLTTQSILIATGVGLTITVLTFDSLAKQLLVYVILLSISLLGIYLLIKMKRLIVARGEDVDYYHNRIIEYEKGLPKEDRVLTAFKVYQKFNRQKLSVDEYFQNFDLTEEIIDQLTEKGKGHTRQFLDQNLFVWYSLIWLIFNLTSVLIIVFSM